MSATTASREENTGNRLAEVARSIFTSVGILPILLVVAVLYFASQEARFYGQQNITNVLRQSTFLIIVTLGQALVLISGGFDLSVGAVIAVTSVVSARFMSNAYAGNPESEWMAVLTGIAAGLCVGLIFGLINGIGVAHLRVPSMIFTLGMNAVAQGLMVLRTGGFAPQDHATDAMHALATGRLLGIPNALFVWAAVGLVTVVLLTRTSFGRAVYAIGNKERAAYLSGIPTQRIMMLGFAASGALCGFAGALLAGYSTKAYQAMGDPYLLPAIAAVVLGGTNILGGRGTYLGTVAGVILITLLQSILSVMQMPEAGRQVIYGLVIIGMLLLYGRESTQR